MGYLIAPIYGNMQDGDVTITTATDAPIDATFTGSSGATTGSGTNASFATGQAVLIHQTTGTGATQCERNYIVGYSAGTITFAIPLSYTYTTGAQILVLKQYRVATLSGGNTLTTKAWDGSLGGVTSFITDRCTLAGTLTATGKGFRGGTTPFGDGAYTGCGEGTGGLRDRQVASSGGNGGSSSLTASGAKAGGGGGGNAASGTTGANAGSSTGGVGGASAGDTLLNLASLGGGGACGGYDGSGGSRYLGNAGGGIIIIFARTLVVSGSVTADGETAAGSGGTNVGGGGGGAGGSILFIVENITLGSNIVTALGSAGRTGVGGSGNGGAGSNGRIAIARCKVTDAGTTNPTYVDRGYQRYCGIIGRG
jgi:hypothetical protein